jgi:hypothetical protein
MVTNIIFKITNQSMFTDSIFEPPYKKGTDRRGERMRQCESVSLHDMCVLTRFPSQLGDQTKQQKATRHCYDNNNGHR